MVGLCIDGHILAWGNVIPALGNVTPALGNVVPALGDVIPALGNVIPPALDNVIAMLDLNRTGKLEGSLLYSVCCMHMLCTRPSAVSMTTPSDHTR